MYLRSNKKLHEQAILSFKYVNLSTFSTLVCRFENVMYKTHYVKTNFR